MQLHIGILRGQQYPLPGKRHGLPDLDESTLAIEHGQELLYARTACGLSAIHIEAQTLALPRIIDTYLGISVSHASFDAYRVIVLHDIVVMADRDAYIAPQSTQPLEQGLDRVHFFAVARTTRCCSIAVTEPMEQRAVVPRARYPAENSAAA